MKTKRLTPLGKTVIFGLVAVIVLTGVYFVGGFDFIKNLNSGNNSGSTIDISVSNTPTTSSSKPNSSNKKDDTLNISLDEWIGWKSVIDANGGLTTQKGSIFDELGINVELHIINDATQSSNALIKGELDGAGYTVNRYAFLHSKFEENKFETVMPFITNYSTGGDGIISKDSINGIEDLVGKKIGVPRFSEAQTMVYWLLNKSDLTDEQIAQIEKDMVLFETPDDAAKAFFAGQIDAAATWQPYLSQAQETSGAKLLFSTKSSNNIILDGIIFGKEYYENNIDTISKFIEGVLKAQELYTIEFASIKNTMPLFSTETNESIVSMTEDASLASYQDNVKLLDDQAKTMFKDMSEIWIQLGEKANPEAAEKAFDSKALKMLDGKFTTTVSSTPKFTEEQREKAKTQENTAALLKKSVSINFQANSAVFVDAEEANEALKEFVEIAKILDGSIIQIEGNVAAVGSNDEAGEKLSLARAKAIAEALKYEGIDPSRFVVIGNGSKNQIAPNDTEENMAKNRRTDIFFKIVE